MENKPLIETVELKKYFKTGRGLLHAVDDVNFKIYKGETLGVVGESGCGKSTLGRTMIRLIEATSGQVLYNGQDILKYDKKQMTSLRKDLQIIFQDPYASLNPRMSVSQLISEPIKVTHTLKDKKEIDDKVLQMMDTVGLAKRFVNSYPHELDGGRRQRIGIARALVVDPKFIVCDEPVSALDVSIQAQILNLLMDLQDEFGLTYMFITHNLSVVKHISTHIAVMYLGQCVEKAPTDELFSSPVHPYTQALLSAVPIPSIDYHVERIVLEGDVPSPINPEPGCRFAGRCRLCEERCHKEMPELRDMGNGHYVACHLV